MKLLKRFVGVSLVSLCFLAPTLKTPSVRHILSLDFRYRGQKHGVFDDSRMWVFLVLSSG